MYKIFLTKIPSLDPQKLANMMYGPFGFLYVWISQRNQPIIPSFSNSDLAYQLDTPFERGSSVFNLQSIAVSEEDENNFEDSFHPG